jgi:ubiquinone/menaquinone biosynthesis C-methylase UbiE
LDDRNFDQKTALEWIRTIEAETSRIRKKDLYPLLNHWIHLTSPSKILEIGSGQGVCSEKLDLRGLSYTGLEPSSFLVERARKLYSSENRNFLVGSVYDLPFSNALFDAAFSVAVWHLLSDLSKAARELSRVLKPQGAFLIVTANPETYSEWVKPYSEIQRSGPRLEGKVTCSDGSTSSDILYLYTFTEIRESLMAAGLQIERTESFRNFICFVGRKSLIS